MVAPQSPLASVVHNPLVSRFRRFVLLRTALRSRPERAEGLEPRDRSETQRVRTVARGPGSTSTEAGFSLVEVMAAMAILVVLTAATVGILINSLEAIRGNSDRVKAASIARTKLAELRNQGADAVMAGSVDNAPVELIETDYDGTGFTVTTTSRWVGFDEDTNPWAPGVGGSPTQGYAQSRIEVVGGGLQAPQFIDAVVPPTSGVANGEGGAATVYVRGEDDQPLSGRQVTATSTAAGAVGQTGLSGTDGCIHFVRLVPGAWAFTLVQTAGEMLQPGTDGARDVPALVVGENVAVDPFVTAQPVAGITLTAGAESFPLPANVPVAVIYGALGPVPRYDAFMPNEPLLLPETGQQLWPDPLGYSATLGCLDAGSALALPVSPGQVTEAQFATSQVEVVGPGGQTVSVTHAADPGGLGLCSGTPGEAGTLVVPDLEEGFDVPSSTGIAGVSLPAGTWTFSTAGEDDRAVTLDGVTACSVHWPPATSPDPTPTPSPTESSSPAPTAQATAPPLEPTLDPCPAATP